MSLIFITNPEVDPGTAFIDFVAAGLPDWLVGVVVVALLTALISTADTEIFMSAILLGKERTRVKKQRLDVGSTRKLVTLFSVVAALGALFLKDLQQAFGVLLNIAYVAGPVAVAVVLNRGGKTKEIKQRVFPLCLALATIAFVAVWVLVGDFFSWWALTIITLAAVPLLVPGAKKRGQAG